MDTKGVVNGSADTMAASVGASTSSTTSSASAGASASASAWSRSLRICMVSDFFHPNLGGVETHIWSLSQCLMQLGHKVIVVTHAFKDRVGVRYMTNGLKVYYLPVSVIHDQIILPTMVSFFPVFRNILIRERISIVHGHQSTSPFAMEAIMYARTLGYRACFTEHSLFGFDDASGIHVNMYTEAVLSDIEHCICVSHTCRENLVLRANLHPDLVSVIPNAVDASKFTPDISKRFPTNTINIVMLSRLVYRKGIDLAVLVIPLICARFPNVHFIIGGDGPKRLLLEEMREKHQLHHRVELLGAVPNSKVRDVLVRGHVFLNCSLTESFCMAILEASSCGLLVVSTHVGGVPEVLPPSMIKYAESTTVESLFSALSEAVMVCRRSEPEDAHHRVVSMYSWMNVCRRTEAVYYNMMQTAKPSLGTRYLRYLSCGRFLGPFMCFLITLMHFMRLFWDWYAPARSIERCVEVNILYPKGSQAYLEAKALRQQRGLQHSNG